MFGNMLLVLMQGCLTETGAEETRGPCDTLDVQVEVSTEECIRSPGMGSRPKFQRLAPRRGSGHSIQCLDDSVPSMPFVPQQSNKTDDPLQHASSISEPLDDRAISDSLDLLDGSKKQQDLVLPSIRSPTTLTKSEECGAIPDFTELKQATPVSPTNGSGQSTADEGDSGAITSFDSKDFIELNNSFGMDSPNAEAIRQMTETFESQDSKIKESAKTKEDTKGPHKSSEPTEMSAEKTKEASRKSVTSKDGKDVKDSKTKSAKEREMRDSNENHKERSRSKEGRSNSKDQPKTLRSALAEARALAPRERTFQDTFESAGTTQSCDFKSGRPSLKSTSSTATPSTARPKRPSVMSISSTAVSYRSEELVKKPPPRASVSTFFTSIWGTRKEGAVSTRTEFEALENAVIIFDWDDTLCPSFWGMSQVKAAKDAKELSKIEQNYSKELDAYVIALEVLLRVAHSVARVAVVTLASEEWFTESSEVFLPGLKFKELLTQLGIPVFHAVRQPKPGSDEDAICIAAKKKAMTTCLTQFYSASKASRWNVLSIGDSDWERVALREVLSQSISKTPLCKTLKFMTHPSIEDLTRQIQTTTSWLPTMLAHAKDFDHESCLPWSAS